MIEQATKPPEQIEPNGADLVLQSYAASQAIAGWAAVHEMRRSIYATWVSIAVNAVVVATALGAPLIQQKWNDHIENITARENKLALLRNMTNSYNSGLEWLNSDDWIKPGPQALTNDERRYYIYWFSRQEVAYSGSLKSKMVGYQSFTSKPNYAMLVNAYYWIDEAIISASRQKIEYIKAFPKLTHTELRDFSIEFDNEIGDQLRNVRRTIRENMLDNGEPTWGVRVRTCSSEWPGGQFETCSQPLRYIAQ
ncbi:hypothetical protein KX816_09385 [Sphingosinicellaceae bacterium]|nr:hypothetical protein KX816_09385 [Sphingosinicellaceae bacterium]